MKKSQLTFLLLFLLSLSGFGQVLNLYSEETFSGDELTLSSGHYNGTLGDFDNQAMSFKLDEGYMATFAQDVNGAGISKVYIASESDLAVVLPNDLQSSISFVRVSPWIDTEKKGSATVDNDITEALNPSWFYDWGYWDESTSTIEYVPMNWSDNDLDRIIILGKKTTLTHHLAFNEPDHLSQANMEVSEAIEKYENLLASGLRLGSPSCTDNDDGEIWRNEFMASAEENDLRVDFIAVHYYRRSTALVFYEWLKAIYDQHEKPIWVTEFNYGATWTDNTGLSLSDILDGQKTYIEMLDTTSFVERYSIFSWDPEDSELFTLLNSSDPVDLNISGEYYASHSSPVAYVQEDYSTDFVPDPTKSYYIDCPKHDLRIAATGESEDAYTTSTSTTGEDVEWKFTAKGNGYWHLDRAAGGTMPRLRTDNSSNADMQSTSYSGSYTYYAITEGYTSGSYFFTLPDGPSSFCRLQVDNSGDVMMVSTASALTWESFSITEVPAEESTLIRVEAEDYSAMSGVVIETCYDTDGGQDVGWIDANDYMEYSVTIPSAGTYFIDYRIASQVDGGELTLTVDGSEKDNVSFDATGDWQYWETVTSSISLSAGTQTFKITADQNGWNLNWFDIYEDGAKSARATESIEQQNSFEDILVYPNPTAQKLRVEFGTERFESCTLYDFTGKYILSQKISENQQSYDLDLDELKRGMYILHLQNANNRMSMRIVKE